jgi:pimeloyl-ACP methyl ester carboxylesterase
MTLTRRPTCTEEIARDTRQPTVAVHALAATNCSDDLRRMAFVHGLAAPWTSWLDLHNCWRVPSTCSFIEMPWGYLDDQTTENWPIGIDNAALLARAIALLPNTPDVLIAHSFGAIVTLDALSRKIISPPRALVLVSPFYRASADDFRWDTLQYYVDDFHLVLEEGLVARRRRERQPRPSHLRGMAFRVRERVGACGWMHFFQAYMKTPTLRADAISVPTLVIGGRRDISAFPADALALASALPQATCRIFDEAGHFVFHEAPEQFAEAVDEFVTSVDIRHFNTPEAITL